ncbi:unnamed protein product [Closterium sp. NIES-54]
MLSLGVRSLEVFSLRVRSRGLLSLRVRSRWVPKSGGAESGGAEPRDTASSGGSRAGGAGATSLGGAGGAGPGGARTRGTRAAEAGGAGGAGARDPGAGGAGARGTGASGRGGTGAASAGGAEGVGARGTGAGAAVGTGAAGTGAGAAGGTRAAGAGGAAGVGARGIGAGAAGGTGAAAAGGVAGVGAGDTGARGAGPEGAGAIGAGSGDTGRPRPYFVPLLQQVLGLPSSTGLTPPLLCPPPDQSQPPLQPASPLPAPYPYTEQTKGLTERRDPLSRPASPVDAVRTDRRVPRPRPPLVLGLHHIALRPSSVPQRVPLASPHASSLAESPDPEYYLACATSPTLPCLLATVVTDPSFESVSASVLVAKLVDFAASCCLDYATSLVAESVSDCPPSIGGECALGTDVLEDKHEDFECFAAAVPHLVSMLIAPEGDPDAQDIPTPRSYIEAITSPYSSRWQTAMDAEIASRS